MISHTKYILYVTRIKQFFWKYNNIKYGPWRCGNSIGTVIICLRLNDPKRSINFSVPTGVIDIQILLSHHKKDYHNISLN